MRDLFVFGIHMDLKWWENEKYGRKESLDYFFHSGFFFLLALSLSCFSPQWLCLTSSPRNPKKPTELVHYDICLNSLPGWKIEKKKHSAHCFPVLHSHLKIRVSHVFFSFSSFSTLDVLVCQQHDHLSSFPSEIFGQLWLNVCITEVTTLTSCLIPGPSQLNWWPE